MKRGKSRRSRGGEIDKDAEKPLGEEAKEAVVERDRHMELERISKRLEPLKVKFSGVEEPGAICRRYNPGVTAVTAQIIPKFYEVSDLKYCKRSL